MTLLTRPRAGAAAVAALALAGGLLTTAPAHAAVEGVLDDRITLERGHIDAFNVMLDGETPTLVLKEDVTGQHVKRVPESVEMYVKPEAWVTWPESFMSRKPADSPGEFYYLPQTEDHSLIWPGWDTQETMPVFGRNSRTDIAISEVDGPGDVFIWQLGAFGDLISRLDGGGHKLPGTIVQPFAAHVHANWAFTAAGTYKFTVRAEVTSEDRSRTATTDTHEYTFVVGERTKLTPEAPEQSGNVVTIPDQKWVTYTDAVTGETLAPGTIALDGDLEVKAVPAYGFDLADDVAAEWAFAYEEPAPSVSITGLGHHYHSGSPIRLTAELEPAVEGATYEWAVQRRDQSAPVPVPGQTGPTLQLAAEQAYDDARVSVTVRDAAGDPIAAAEPVTIDVDDHGAAPLQKVSINGVSDHYHTGDTATLTASVQPASVLTRFEWYVQKDDETQPQLVEGENDATYSFTVTEELDGAAVIARLTYDDGAPYVESPPVVIHLDDHGHGVPDTELSIQTDRAADDYWVGQTARLTATQEPATGLSQYRWLVREPGAEEFTAVEGVTTGEYSFKPTLANSGIQVKVQLLHDGEVHAESAPVTITAGLKEPVTTLTASADKEAYRPGETAHFTSQQNPQTDEDHYHWYIKRAGASDFVWVDQSRDKDLDYPVTAEDDGAQFVVRLFDDEHAVLAESAPVTLTVDTSNGGEPLPTTELSIDGLAPSYVVGDTATLRAVQRPETGEDHYHWFIQRSGDADYSVIPGALSGTLQHIVAEGDAGARIRVSLYDHDHRLIATSQPVALSVLPSAGGSVKPADPPARQTAAVLDGVPAGGVSASTTTPARGQVITLRVGDGTEHAGEWVAAWLFSTPTLLGGDWLQVSSQGTLAVTIPADAALGDHRIAVFAADGSLIGWQQLSVTAQPAGAGGETPAGDRARAGALPATGGDFEAAPLWAGAAFLVLGAALVTAVAHRRRSRIDAG